MRKTITIGTRGSKLALYQAYKVKDVLKDTLPNLVVDVKVIKTKGDKILDVALSKIGDKGLFTKEIEVQLLNGDVDIAVHSCKDLPTQLPKGLLLGAVLERAEYRDALVSKEGKTMEQLTENDVLATSSLRRQAGFRSHYPEVAIKDIRGNVQTRLSRMEEGYCDAMIMAAAGLQRLGLEKYITEIIEPTVIMPAVAQGAIAIEMREDDSDVAAIMAQINHTPTWLSILAERAFLRTLEGGCQVPLGCYSQIEGEQIILHGFVASVDGEKMVKGKSEGLLSDPEACGIALANELIDQGATLILNAIKHQH